ncbi:MAG: tetratricopeptide repeat protein [Thermoanaerobaculia bacterium]|nr:tetratricopeptide repeat protein [Thermoanaerobaculia bacterium]
MVSRKRISGAAILVAVGLLGVGGAAVAKPPTAADQLDFGVQMAKRGLWGEALFRFRAASELSPGDARILNNLAVAYEAVGRFDDALETYQKAIRSAPGNRELKRNYQQFLEFYQGFRPRETEEADGSEEEPEGDSGEGGGAAADR